MDRRNFFKILGLGTAIAAGKKLEGKIPEEIVEPTKDVLDKRVKPQTFTASGSPISFSG